MTTVPKIEELEKIPRSELGTLSMFLIGINVREKLGRSTFEKHRRSLLQRGFDITRQVATKFAPETKSLEQSQTQFR